MEEFVNKRWQTYFKQDDKIVSTGTLWLKWQFDFQYQMIFCQIFLIYDSDFIVYTDS